MDKNAFHFNVAFLRKEKPTMTKKNKKILYSFVSIFFLLLFTSCTTRFGGIDGAGIELSLGYIIGNSILGSIVFILSILIILGLKYNRESQSWIGNFVYIFGIFVSIFLFILPFFFSTIPSGLKNLFWLKALTSSFILCIVISILISCEKFNFFEIFIFYIVNCAIEIIGLIYSGEGSLYISKLWSFSHLVVLYNLFCLIIGYHVSKRSKVINGFFKHFWGAIFAIGYGSIGFLPLILEIPKNIWGYILLVGFVIGCIFYKIFSEVTEKKYNLYLEQEKKEKEFFDNLTSKKNEIKTKITKKRGCPQYDKTIESIDKAESVEEIDKLFSEWYTYELKHTFCPICNMELNDNAKYCNYCYVSLDQPYPICPECGKKIDYISEEKCSNCDFEWNEFLENKLKDREKYDVLKFEMEQSLFSEGYFQSGHLEDVYKYDKNNKKNYFSLNDPICAKGIVHFKKDNNKIFYLYSPKLFSDTYKEYNAKVEKEALEKKLREEQAEKERKLEEEKQIRKEKKEQELKKRIEEKLKLKKQEYAKKVSEQTGIIFD